MSTKPSVKSSQVDRVLIVRLSALGDVVNALPALTALREMLPDAHIAWAVEPPHDALLYGHPMLDEVIPVPRHELVAKLRSPLRWPAFLGGLRELRTRLHAGRFDITLDLQGNLRSGVVTRLSGAPRRVGFDRRSSKEFSHLACTHHVDLPAGTLHRVERGLKLLSFLGDVPSNPAPYLPLTAPDRDFAEAFFREHFRAGESVAVLHPGVSRFGIYKQWPAERYVELCGLLAGEMQIKSLLTWGPDERELCELIAARVPSGVVMGPETRSVAQLAALIRRCDVFVGSDSGPARLAWAVGTPQVVIFGPKDPAVYGPTDATGRVVEHDIHCRPCGKRTCPDPVCVTDITAGEVLDKVRELKAPTP